MPEFAAAITTKAVPSVVIDKASELLFCLAFHVHRSPEDAGFQGFWPNGEGQRSHGCPGSSSHLTIGPSPTEPRSLPQIQGLPKKCKGCCGRPRYLSMRTYRQHCSSWKPEAPGIKVQITAGHSFSRFCLHFMNIGIVSTTCNNKSIGLLNLKIKLPAKIKISKSES